MREGICVTSSNSVVFNLLKVATPPKKQHFFQRPSLKMKILYLNNQYKISV